MELMYKIILRKNLKIEFMLNIITVKNGLVEGIVDYIIRWLKL